MVQIAEIIRMTQCQYFESGETCRMSAINGGMLEDTALDMLAEWAGESDDMPQQNEGDFRYFSDLDFDAGELPVCCPPGVPARHHCFIDVL